MDWLFLPIDPGRPHDISFAISWHARVMVLSWAILFPLGILAARYFKVLPGQDFPNQLDNRVWWRSHLTMQYLGGALVAVGVWLIWSSNTEAGPGIWHAVLGWTAVSMCSLQFLSGWLRGTKGGPTEPRRDGSIAGDHYDMSPRRCAFEYYHKFAGYIGLLSAWSAILFGLWHVNAPVWMWVALISWWALLVSVFVYLQKLGRCVDTYEAIWGPDPALPGRTRGPIGFGVRSSGSGVDQAGLGRYGPDGTNGKG